MQKTLAAQQSYDEKIATFLLLAEIYTRQSLLYLDEANPFASSAYQLAIEACWQAEDKIQEANEQAHCLDIIVLQESNTESLADPNAVRVHIDSLLKERIHAFIDGVEENLFVTTSSSNRNG